VGQPGLLRRILTAAPAGLAVALAVAFAFRGVLGNGFLLYDDSVYLTDTPLVRAGLTREGVVWAFTAFHGANWHPLTWISHMLDAQFFGLDPAGHHGVSLLLHVLNVALLSLLARRLLGASWPSFLAALLFGLHPLRVESVAWVAERKDVLCAFFWLLAMGAHLRYAARPGAGRMLPVALLLAGALMAKPMAVTLPLVLLLLDWWPLGRGVGRGLAGAAALVAEKIPLFFLAAASSLVTLRAQASADALSMGGGHHAWPKAVGAVMAVVHYLVRTLFPAGLMPLYPYPAEAWPWWQWGGAALILAGVTAFLAVLRRRHPALLMGWLWFLVVLIPVSGLVKVGVQMAADRYTYLPHAGLALGLAGVMAGTRGGSRFRNLAVAPGIAAAAALLALLTLRQVPVWRDDLTLFGENLRRDPGNWLALQNVGAVLSRQGRLAEARRLFTEALGRHPDNPYLRYNLAVVSDLEGRDDIAETLYREVIRMLPDHADAHNNLGILLSARGRREEAAELYRRAMALDPQRPEPCFNLALDLLEAGRGDLALPLLRRALALDPDYEAARRTLDRLLGPGP
jgi:hypothetical protein